MGRSRWGYGAAVGLVLLTACNEEVEHHYPDVDGDYAWYGSGVFFVEGKYGLDSEAAGFGTHATIARLTTERGQLYLNIPPCQRILLERSGERGQILIGRPQRCELSSNQKALGVRSQTLTALRIDLDQRVMHRRFCQYGGFFTGCGGTDSVFVPLGNVGEGGTEGGAGGLGGEGPTLAVADTESEAIWTFGREGTTLWRCDEVDPNAEGCVSGDGLMNHRTDGVMGTVHRLKDGRYYLDGFDCFGPVDDQDEAVSCQQALDGLAVPAPWVSRFVVLDEHLSFEAEMIGFDYMYYVRLEAELTPVSEVALYVGP